MSKQDKADEKIAELTNDVQRIQAEFENYKKRVEKERQSYCDLVKSDLVAKILPAMDNFELAFNNTENHEEFVKGVQLIFSQLFQALEDEGLSRIEAINKKFDPHLHEALLTEEREGVEENTVIEELQKGYMFKDKVIRHTKVKISR